MRRLKPEVIKLLRRIKRHILAEPKRIDMTVWLKFRNEFGLSEQQAIYDKHWPKCGTVGCIGGWVEHLHNEDHPRSEPLFARSILGLTYEQERDLCYDEDLIRAENPQTLRHARAVAAHIDRFIRKNR